MDKTVRVRFAPSPTGTLHVGGARTALFNWLFARNQGGTFILRIEDTDQTRYDKSAEEAMIKDLEWLGLNWDEGPDKDGPHAPYRQSYRLNLYKKHAEELVTKKAAYYCFCSSERLDKIRKVQKENKQRMGYDKHCRTLSETEVRENLNSGMPYVIRLKVPQSGSTTFTDFVRGNITYQNEDLDDLILFKSNGFPSYHLANVVDDHHMKISHVLRGDEWIPSTPKHKLIYDSFGWEPPVFIHLPVILAEGGGKLSKRKGASSVTDYKDKGYMPNTLNNFLALLGWNPGNDVELMSRDELISNFTIKKIIPKSCAFDEKKLEWMNGQYFIKATSESLLKNVRIAYAEAGVDTATFTDDYVIKIITLMKERIKKFPEFPERASYFFMDPLDYDKKARKKFWKEDAKELLQKLITELETSESFEASSLETLYKSFSLSLKLPNAGKLIHPTRLAISGVSFGPGLFELMELLTKETVLRRMYTAVKFLEQR